MIGQAQTIRLELLPAKEGDVSILLPPALAVDPSRRGFEDLIDASFPIFGPTVEDLMIELERVRSARRFRVTLANGRSFVAGYYVDTLGISRAEIIFTLAGDGKPATEETPAHG